MQSIVKNNPNQEYKIIDLSIEYAGATAFVGTERYAIVTDLTEEELTSAFGQELGPYKPFVIISHEMYEAMLETHRNDNREHWRDMFCHDSFAIDMENLPIDWKADPANICESLRIVEYIFSKMKELPDWQGLRLYEKYIIGYSNKEIADKDGVSKRAVRKGIRRAKHKIHDAFVEMGVVA